MDLLRFAGTIQCRRLLPEGSQLAATKRRLVVVAYAINEGTTWPSIRDGRALNRWPIRMADAIIR